MRSASGTPDTGSSRLAPSLGDSTPEGTPGTGSPRLAPSAGSTSSVPMALAVPDVPEAVQVVDGGIYDGPSGPILAELQRLLAVEFPPEPDQLPSLRKLSELGCLASAVMDVFAQQLEDMERAHGRVRGRGELARWRRKEFGSLRSSIRKAFNALPGARGSACTGLGRRPIRRRGTRRGRLARRLGGLVRRRTARREG